MMWPFRRMEPTAEEKIVRGMLLLWLVYELVRQPPKTSPGERTCKCRGCDEASCGLPDCDECEADR